MDNANQESTNISGFVRFWLTFRRRIIIGAIIGLVVALMGIIGLWGGGHAEGTLINILASLIFFIIGVVGGGVAGFILPFIWKYVIKPVGSIISFILSLFDSGDNSSSTGSYSSRSNKEIRIYTGYSGGECAYRIEGDKIYAGYSGGTCAYRIEGDKIYTGYSGGTCAYRIVEG
jgi:hypothetical protein